LNFDNFWNGGMQRCQKWLNPDYPDYFTASKKTRFF
jgi:hypothetical protein